MRQDTLMPTTSQSTSEIGDLLSGLDLGEPAARNLLIERCRERFRRRAAQMLGGFQKLRRDLDTSDVEQELHLRLCKSLAIVKVNDVQHLFRLANETLRRYLIDCARKWRAQVNSDASYDRIDPSPDPGRLAVLAEIQEWIGTLNEQKREIFDLMFYQELSETEIGRIIGKSRKVVSRMKRELEMECVEKFGENL
jgi:RNA polymerase sigma factor (sigma-70 family)